MSRKVLKKSLFEDEDADADDDLHCPPQQDDDEDDGDYEEEGGKKIRGVDPPGHVPWTSPNELQASCEAKNTAQCTSGSQHMVSPVRGPDVSTGAAMVESQGRPSIIEERRPGAVKIPGRDRRAMQGTSGGQHVVSPAMSQVTGPSTSVMGRQGHHHPFLFEERRPGGAVAIPGIDVNEGYEDQATVATRDDPTVNVVAQVADMEEENRRLCDQERMHHEQDRMRHELDQAVHERDQLRRMVDNAVVVTPVVATNRDEVLGNEEVVQVPPGSSAQKDTVKEGISNRCRQWQLAGASLLVILIVLAIVLSITLSKEPTPAPTLLPEDEELRDFLSSASSDGGEALRTQSTPQNKALLDWLIGNSNLGTYTNKTILQRYALAMLYFSMNGVSWENNALWLDNGNECSRWGSSYGRVIICTDTGAVVDLDLSDNSLSGMLPPEIGLLTSLGKCIIGKEWLSIPLVCQIVLRCSVS
jgi:hypothetical protein